RHHRAEPLRREELGVLDRVLHVGVAADGEDAPRLHLADRALPAPARVEGVGGGSHLWLQQVDPLAHGVLPRAAAGLAALPWRRLGAPLLPERRLRAGGVNMKLDREVACAPPMLELAAMTVLQVADLGFGYGARGLFQGI